MSNTRDSNGDTQLITAIRNNNVDQLRSLLKDGADVNGHDISGNSPLHIAMLYVRSVEIFG